MDRTPAPVRMFSANERVSRLTYSRLPPSTVRHCGRSNTCISPWLAQNRMNADAG